MERLQTALQKARLARQGIADKFQSPAVQKAVEKNVQNVEQAWSEIEELKLQPGLLHRNRLLALNSGPEASAFDLLRTKLLRFNRQNGWKRIAIVSAAAAAGKSTTLTNLAFSFSRQRDVRAIVFDFDLRRPSMARLLGQQPKHNMGQVLRGEVPFPEHAKRIGHNLLFALNNGATRHSAELLQSNETYDMLNAIEDTYANDLMLFDMPPMLVADDAHGFLRSVDAALIVMEAEKTPVKQIDVVERQVAELTNVAGIVLNKCNYTDELYSSSYGYY